MNHTNLLEICVVQIIAAPPVESDSACCETKAIAASQCRKREQAASAASKAGSRSGFPRELCGHDYCGHEPALPAFSTDAHPPRMRLCCLVFQKYNLSISVAICRGKALESRKWKNNQKAPEDVTDWKCENRALTSNPRRC